MSAEQIMMFISVVQNDRKFFLPATQNVLRSTIRRKASDCSSLRIGRAFEAIHQFANNLYAKPWRPEYRTIRTYSGFYQQDIEAHLFNAEQLFNEMGYQRQPNGTLLLEGDVCLDQVSNVSRDAIIAFVECQLMSAAFAGLVRLQCTPTPSLADVYAVREQLVGDADDTIETILRPHRGDIDAHATTTTTTADATFGTGYHNQHTPLDSVYGGGVATPLLLPHLSPAVCPQHNHSVYSNELYAGGMPLPLPPPPPQTATQLRRHVQQTPNDFTSYANMQHQRNDYAHHPSGQHQFMIPHSRSLDQQFDASVDHQTQMKRHSSSFDQPDCNAHRSNAASGHAYATSTFGPHIPYRGDYQHQQQQHQLRGSYSARSRDELPSFETNRIADQARHQQYQQQLLHQQQFLLMQQQQQHLPLLPTATTYAQTVKQSRTAITQTPDMLTNDLDGEFGRLSVRLDGQPPLQPILVESGVDQQHRQHHHSSHRHNNRSFACQPLQTGYNNEDDDDAGDGNDTTDSLTSRGLSDLDSTDEHRTPATNNNGGDNNSYATKCSDGIGRAEQWNFVYSQLQRSGYSKDLGERGDILQSNIGWPDAPPPGKGHHQHGVLDARQSKTGATKKTTNAMRSSESVGVVAPPDAYASVTKSQRKSREPAPSDERPNEVRQRSQRNKRTNGHGAVRTLSPAAPSANKVPVPYFQPSAADRHSASQRAAPEVTLAVRPAAGERRTRSPAAITEWACTSCTFLNPIAARVCDVCTHSKDYVLPKGTTTCV